MINIFFFFLVSKLMDRYNYIDKPFNLNMIYEQLNSCRFIPETVDNNNMDKLGREIVPSLLVTDGNSLNMFEHSSIFKSLSLEAALITNSEERTNVINRMFYTISHLESKNIVIHILMSLINWTFDTEEKVVWKLDELGFTNVSKIVQLIRIILIMNVWTDKEYKENEIWPNLLEKNILELLSHIIVVLAEHFKQAYNFAISIPVQVSILNMYYVR